MTTSKRSITRATVILAALMLAAPQNGSAAIPARETTEVFTVSAPITAGDEILVGCGRNPGATTSGAVFATADVVDAAGRHHGGPVAGTAIWQEAFYTYRVGETSGGEALGSREYTEGYFASAYSYAGATGTLTGVWARWGSDLACAVWINRVEVTGWQTPAGARGFYALTTDFTDGAALAAQTCLQPLTGCPGATVAAKQVLHRESHGRLFGLFQPIVGLYSATGPEGQRYESATSPTAAAFATVTSGTWIYRIDAQAVPETGPVLYLIELPA